MAENIASQLERRISHRRAMKQSILRTMRAGAKGVRIMMGGRLRGAEMARREQDREGRVPLHTLRADIQFGRATAKTTFGMIGIKVWIYKDEFKGRTRGGEAQAAIAPQPTEDDVAAAAQQPAGPQRDGGRAPGQRPRRRGGRGAGRGQGGAGDTGSPGQRPRGGTTLSEQARGPAASQGSPPAGSQSPQGATADPSPEPAAEQRSPETGDAPA